MLVDEAESGNTVAPTLSTTPRNTAVPAAATYRPTVPPFKTGKSKQKEKLSTESENPTKSGPQKDSPQTSEKISSQSGKNSAGDSITKTEKQGISGVDKPLYGVKEAHKEPVEQSQASSIDAHAQSSVPFQQINEPEEQSLPQGNLMHQMDQSGNIKPHAQMNAHHVLPGIDPSIVEDTYNGMYRQERWHADPKFLPHFPFFFFFFFAAISQN